MLLRLLIPKRIGQLGERIGFIDHRLHIMGLDRGNHIGLILLTAHGNATQPAILGHQCRSGHLTRPTGEYTDQANTAIHRQRADGLRQVTWAAHFNHQIHTGAAGQLKRLLTPVGVGLVIDQVLSAQGTEPLELGIGGRGSDHAAPHHARHL